MIEFISIFVLTFALALLLLGIITIWLEHGRGRAQGVALTIVGLVVGSGYAFLGSRFSEALFGRLIVAVDLRKLMATAFTYTAGVLGGGALAVSLFLWATGRFRYQPERTVTVYVLAGLLIAIAATLIAVIFSGLR